MIDYAELLERSYATELDIAECPPQSRLEFLSEHVFNFTTYDSEMGALFAGKAIEVCKSITNKTTFDYIEDTENYRWFLLMCNTCFFSGRLEWGTSIRGAWWRHKQELSSCGLWSGDDDQITSPLTFDAKEWEHFMRAVIDFAEAEGKP